MEFKKAWQAWAKKEGWGDECTTSCLTYGAGPSFGGSKPLMIPFQEQILAS